MNPSTQNVSQKEAPADKQDKNLPEAQLSRESIDSATGAERIKGIIKIDHNSPEPDSPDLVRLKSKIVSFSSYDDCFNRGFVPSKSIQVNLDDDTIPDKAIIERRLSKLEEERNSITEVGATNVPNPADDKKAVQEPAEKKPEAEERVEEKKAVEETVEKKQDAEVHADDKKVVEEPVSSQQAPVESAKDEKAPEEPAKNEKAPEEPAKDEKAPEEPVKDEKVEEATVPVHDVHEDNDKKPANLLGHLNEDTKLSELIDAMRPDQSIPRQFVIVEYIEQFCIDDNEDPDVKAIFDCHHNAPNLACFTGKTNQTQRQCTVPVTENIIKVFDEINKAKHTEIGQGVTEQANDAETTKLPGIQIGYEYHGPSTSITDKTNLFSFCNCPRKELNCAKPTSSHPTYPAQKTAKNKQQISKHGLKKIKSNKMVKGPQKVKSSVTANHNSSKGSKSRVHSANRKRENKKRK